MATRTALFLLALSSCVNPAPSIDNATYVVSLHPLLHENSLLAQRMLETAADVHAEKADGARAAETWRTDIVPLAQHLHDQAGLVNVPGPWVDAHGQLVTIWGSRAEGYALILEGIERGDAQRWKRGRSLADKAKLEEETWFQTTNKRLAPENLSIDQFP